MTTRMMPCRGCTPNGRAVFERTNGYWVCRNCEHSLKNSAAEMLEILRQYAPNAATTPLQAVVVMDAEIKRLRATQAAAKGEHDD
ncbi:hypothetical protein [Delftia acidovorans]|uniref:hypothetical protein n=1 Tax=Delftia acidovorans TaxID=80866 RepID=UPI000BD507CB|nr:hypothetical protein [Delftia acidovorans]SOE35248.1 hypothetical protein SAMN05216519_1228 [Delftia acidovorans]